MKKSFLHLCILIISALSLFGLTACDDDENGTNPTSTDTTPPSISSLSPANNATDVALNSNLVITFSEIVVAQTGNITLYKGDGSQVQTFDVTSGISGSGTNTITIDPTNDLAAGTNYYVLIDATAFADNAGNSFAGISGTADWAFKTASGTTPTTNGKIAFYSDRDGNEEIYVMDADGSNQTNLTNNAAADNVPRWSPDKSKIAFYSNRDDVNGEIYVMDADGSNQTRLTTSHLKINS